MHYGNSVLIPTPSPPPRRSHWLPTVMAILLLAVAGVLVWLVLDRRGSTGTTTPTPVAGGPATSPVVTPRSDLDDGEKTNIEVYKNVSPSVVNVTSIKVQNSHFSLSETEIPLGMGTGFVWDNQGHVVTNFHVVEGASKARVTLNDKTTYEATVVGTHPDKDIAVLRLVGVPPNRIKPVAVGTSSDLLVGQRVLAIGNPFGLDQTLTTGIISGLGREIKSMTQRPIQDVIQTDAAINRGNSGGPLLDSSGRVIGINTAIYSPSGASAGIGFAVPIDTVSRVVPQLVQYGKAARPGLGIRWVEAQIIRQHFPDLKGVVIRDVTPGGAAALAGLEGVQTGPAGDRIGDVIVGMDSQPITSIDDLFRALDRYKVGDRVSVKVERDGKVREVSIILQDVPTR